MKLSNRRPIAGVIMVVLTSISQFAFCAETISDKGYYVIVLERRNAIMGRFVDAVVCTRAGSGHRFIRRLDEDYRLVLNAPDGAQAPEVTSANFPKYDTMIRENHLSPRTIRDNRGRELAIVYCGLSPCYVDGQIRPDGSIILDVKGSVFPDQKSFRMLDREMMRD